MAQRTRLFFELFTPEYLPPCFLYNATAYCIARAENFPILYTASFLHDSQRIGSRRVAVFITKSYHNHRYREQEWSHGNIIFMDFITNLISSFQHIGYGGYWLVLLISFAESLAFVGAFVPGAVFIILAGFLSSQGYLDIRYLIWFAAIGAILGDTISYYLGTKGTKLFKNENRFLKANHLDMGKKFFEKHGNKSIFLGRFVGLLRPIIPFVAGISGMNKKFFLFWNILSGFLWSASNLLLGYFFGENIGNIEAWSGRLGIYILIIILLGILTWFYVKKTHIFTAFLNHRLDRKKITGLPLTIMFIAFVYFLFLLVGLIRGVLTSDLVVNVDNRIEIFFYTFRNPNLINFFLWITLLGKGIIVISIAFISSIILWLTEKRVYIFSLWLTITGSALISFLGKILINRPRPGGLIPFYQEPSLSFPSGHATIAVALYGFIIYVIWKNHTQLKYKNISLFIGLTIIILIGLSRLYLGVHFLSDIIGGYFIGLLWLIAVITITEWYIHKKSIMFKPFQISNNIKYIVVGIIGLELIFYGVYAYNYKPVLNTYQPVINFQNAKK